MCSRTSTLKPAVTYSCCLKVLPGRPWAPAAQTINQLLLTTVSFWLKPDWSVNNPGARFWLTSPIGFIHWVGEVKALPCCKNGSYASHCGLDQTGCDTYCPLHSLNQREFLFKFLHPLTLKKWPESPSLLLHSWHIPAWEQVNCSHPGIYRNLISPW